MHIDLLSVGCLTALLPGLLAAQQPSDHPSAKVDVIAFDTNGSLLGPPTVKVFESADGRSNLASMFHVGSADHVPYGNYRLEAYLPAYWSEVRYIRIYQPHVTVIVGLTFGLELPQAPRMLKGRILGQIPPKGFVKLIGTYSNISMESAIDADGNFSLGGLSDGKFLLLVVGEKGILASRTVDIPYVGPALEVEVGRDKAGGPQ
jgi:hypothetical protein